MSKDIQVSVQKYPDSSQVKLTVKEDKDIGYLWMSEAAFNRLKELISETEGK